MQLGLGWIFVGAYAVENGRSIDIALLPASSLYMYRGDPPIRNWHHEMYHLLSLKMTERVGPKSPLIS